MLNQKLRLNLIVKEYKKGQKKRLGVTINNHDALKKRSPVSSTLCKASSFPFEHTFLKHFIMQIALDIEYFISKLHFIDEEVSRKIFLISYSFIFILSFSTF